MSIQGPYGRKAASGAAYIGFAQGVRVVFTILMTIIVARLVSPDDYGVIAMVAPVTAFLLMFRHLGLSQAVIQARELSDDQSNALFWINMAASVVLTVALLALSPAVAWFYGDPRPGYVTAASAATVLVGGAAIQHMALLNREMQFGRLGTIEIASATITLAATVGAAWVMRNYWAIWLGTFIATLATNFLIWRSSRWRPSFKVSFKGLGNMVRFGGAVTGFNLINFLHRNLDNVLIGKVWGPTLLGLYDRSYRLMMFPLQNINAPIGRVILPVLSRLQDEPERFRRSYLLTVRAIMLVSVPAIAVAAATSDRLVPFLLGERWAGAAPIFFWLSLAAFIQPIGNSTGWLFISSGRPGAMMRWATVYTGFMVPAFIVGVRSGPIGVAIAYFVVAASSAPFLFAYCVRGTALRVIDMYAVCLPPFAAAALTWAAIHWLMPPWPMVGLLAVALPLSYSLCLIALWISPGGRDAIRTLSSLAIAGIASRLPRRGQS